MIQEEDKEREDEELGVESLSGGSDGAAIEDDDDDGGDYGRTGKENKNQIEENLRRTINDDDSLDLGDLGAK